MEAKQPTEIKEVEDKATDTTNDMKLNSNKSLGTLKPSKKS
jgi:hypothetical protein